MKLGLLAAASVVLGLGLGIGVGYWEYQAPGKQLQAKVEPTPLPVEGPPPVVSIDRDVYEFGTMEAGAKSKRDFVFTNVGQGVLRLKAGKTTCKCTLTALQEKAIPPGGSGVVSLEWTADQGVGPFRQSAEILTNDPKRPRVELVIHGEVVQAVRLEPETLVFSNLALNDTTTGSVAAYAYLSEGLEVLSHRFDDRSTAPYFEVAYEPIPPSALPEQAKSGVRIHVTVKPGLPLGTVRQTIRLRTNLETQPEVEVPIEGTVTSDISVLGPSWSPSLGILSFGRVDSRQGASRTLKLLVRGPERDKVEFKVHSVEPSLLKVTIGEKGQLSGGNVTVVPVTIEIPKGSPTANHLGSQQGKLGEVLLDTTHPEVRQIRLKVQFAVEGR